MSVSTGDQLGPYAIQDRLGAGGMGEVYRAQDTRLGRSVAIKISAERFTERFEREARVVAALNHPNICTLFDVGPNYLVMELVDGPTLADRIQQGPIPLDEALCLARQIAEALQAAHEKGIVHRDLKPANIKLRADGSVKVLDFGLATAGTTTAGPITVDSPTYVIGTTEAGMILGTAGYMSPEQARGKTVDKRADIWAYGVVLYEMLTGRKLFEGETVSDSLASVLTKEPDLNAVPPEAQRLVRNCLQRDARKRLQDIGDAHLLLDDTRPAATTAAPQGRGKWLWPAASVVLALVLFAIVILYLRRNPPGAETARFQIPLPAQLAFSSSGAFTLSPDGRKIVFPAVDNGIQSLWIRTLDSVDARLLPDTNGATASPPFWSPDSRFVVFEADGRLKKVDINGRPPQNICEAPARERILGGSWNRDGVIIFGNLLGVVMRVSAAGGTATPVTALDHTHDATGHLYPVFMPDGKHFLYMRFPQGPADAGVYAGSLDSKPEQQSLTALLATPRAGISWVASADSNSGRILYWRDRVVYAQGFNHRKLTLEGEPKRLVEHVGYNISLAFPMISASADNIIYRSVTTDDLQLTWLDRNGKPLGAVGEAGLFRIMALSRDGRRVAVARTDPSTYNIDLWLIDTSSGATARFTFDPGVDSNPVWSPDGSRLIFVSYRGGTPGFYEKPANGAGGEKLFLNPVPAVTLTDWSRDGRYLIFHGNGTIWVLPSEGDRKPIPFLHSNFNARGARLSPDGRVIAFTSSESGRDEVYVESFTPSPDAGSAASTGKWMVSKGGSQGMIHWRDDGKELFYLGLDGTVMAVPVTTAPKFQAGTPEALFKVPDAKFPLGAVAPDGKRFLLALPKDGTARQELTMVMNWDQGAKK